MTAGTATPAGRAAPAGPATREASVSWQALGTGVQVVVTDGSQLTAARGMLEADLAAVDQACSRFRPDSEIVALDLAMAGAPSVCFGTAPQRGAPRPAEPVEVSPLLAEAISVALRAARLTGGDVDPTVGAAMNAIGYDRDFSLVQREGPAVKLTVRAFPGWRQVEFDEQARLLRVPPGVQLDLGATAKAWAADRSPGGPPPRRGRPPGRPPVSPPLWAAGCWSAWAGTSR
jgi:thiamine biosynthesis lipoprotein